MCHPAAAVGSACPLALAAIVCGVCRLQPVTPPEHAPNPSPKVQVPCRCPPISSHASPSRLPRSPIPSHPCSLFPSPSPPHLPPSCLHIHPVQTQVYNKSILLAAESIPPSQVPLFCSSVPCIIAVPRSPHPALDPPAGLRLLIRSLSLLHNSVPGTLSLNATHRSLQASCLRFSSVIYSTT